MSIPIDLELRKAFSDLQGKMTETRKKIKVIDTKIGVLRRLCTLVAITRQEIDALPPGTKTYETVGRMFLLEDLEEVQENLITRELEVQSRASELENNKRYLQKKLRESGDNIREMVQQRKHQNDKSS